MHERPIAAAAIPRAILVLRKLASNSAPPMALPQIRGRFPERSGAMFRARAGSGISLQALLLWFSRQRLSGARPAATTLAYFTHVLM